MTTRKPPRSWPLWLIAAPAAVAVWSGWVGLGELCGFGIIHPLPGIWEALRLNTAITLPVGVEAYGAFALGSWLRPGAPSRARTFARRSGIGSLCLGMLGQVTFHLLTAAHAHRAPWPVVVLVSCLPVVTLGFGVALAHLLRAEAEAETVTAEPVSVAAEPVSQAATEPVHASASETESEADAIAAEPVAVADGQVSEATAYPLWAEAEADNEADTVTAEPVIVTDSQVSEPVTLPVTDRPAIESERPVTRPAIESRRPVTRRMPTSKHDRSSAPDREAAALSLLSRDPDMTGGELARQLGVSPRTGQRYRDRLSKSVPTP